MGNISACISFKLQQEPSLHNSNKTFWTAFGEKAWLPSLPNEEIQKIHYGETSAAESFNLLQQLQKLVHEFAT